MREWLRNSRVEKDLTMKELGTRLGISESYYCSIESGIRQKKMDMALVAALAVALDMPVAVIAQHECEYLATSTT